MYVRGCHGRLAATARLQSESWAVVFVIYRSAS